MFSLLLSMSIVTSILMGVLVVDVVFDVHSGNDADTCVNYYVGVDSDVHVDVEGR